MQGYMTIRAHGGVPPHHPSARRNVPPSLRWLSAGITEALLTPNLGLRCGLPPSAKSDFEPHLRNSGTKLAMANKKG
jgi:hypothetical protein